MKMRKKLGILALCMLLLVGCGNNSENNNNTDISENNNATANNSESSQISESEEDNGYQRYKFHIGESAKFESGLVITLTDTGRYKENIYDKDNVYAYITLDFENTGSEDISFSPASVEFYGDGYLLELGLPFQTDSMDAITISPGRRAKGSIYAKCDNYDYLTSIEAEYGDAIFVIAEEEDYEPIGDNGIEEMFIEVISQMEGMYSDIEGYGIQVKIELNENGLADITFMTEGYEPDYIFKDCAPIDESLEIQIWQDGQEIYIHKDEDGYLSVNGCDMKTYNTIYEQKND